MGIQFDKRKTVVLHILQFRVPITQAGGTA